MLIGNKDVFAIDCSNVEAVNTSLFADMCMWANGFRIGEPNDCVDIYGVRFWMRRFVDEFLPHLHRPDLENEPPEIVLSKLWNTIYPDGNDVPNLPSDWNGHSRCQLHHVDSFMMSSFWDHVDCVMLVTTSNMVRLIWRIRDTVDVHETIFPLCTFLSVCSEFLRWADEKHEQHFPAK